MQATSTASLPQTVVSFLNTLGILHPNDVHDPSVGLINHIVDCVGALKSVNEVFKSKGSIDSKGIGSRALFGFYVELGKIVFDTIAFKPPEEFPDACNGYEKVSENILRVFPDLAAQKNTSTGRLLIHHAAFRCNNKIGTKMVHSLLKAYPAGSSHQDSSGALPLHWAASSSKAGSEIVDALLKINPSAASASDKSGFLPLHWVVDKDSPNPEVLHSLLKVCPMGAQQPGRDGMLPLHWSLNRSNPSVESIEALLQVYPTALRTQAPNGLLPLHISTSQPNPNAAIIDSLIHGYPDASKIVDKYGRYPLHLASSAISPDDAVIRSLIKIYPEALHQGDAAGWLPLHLSCWASGCETGPSMSVVQLIAEKYPGAAHIATRGGLLAMHCAVSVPHPNHEIVALLKELYPEAATTYVSGEPEGGPGFGRWTPLSRVRDRGLRNLYTLLATGINDDVIAMESDAVMRETVTGTGTGTGKTTGSMLSRPALRMAAPPKSLMPGNHRTPPSRKVFVGDEDEKKHDDSGGVNSKMSMVVDEVIIDGSSSSRSNISPSPLLKRPPPILSGPPPSLLLRHGHEITATKLVRTKSKNAYEVVTDTGEKVSPRLVREGRVPPPGPSRATVVSRPTFRATDKARVKAPPPMAQRQYDDMV
eukprot:gene1554-3005_t